ncbi:LysR family transcriptional regulator [Nonomuraea sp. NPDC003709]|uniref:LysR family transcriptional regulator n=1 Tax=Nonomuraea sp. NPDC003709 TaxID=3154450 RepID=UPI0033A0322D
MVRLRARRAGRSLSRGVTRRYGGRPAGVQDLSRRLAIESVYRYQPTHPALLPGRGRRTPFGRAAMRLYISQPSLSHQIRKLEETLETPLFVRSSSRAQLTAAGRTLAREAPMEQAVQLNRVDGARDTSCCQPHSRRSTRSGHH